MALALLSVFEFAPELVVAGKQSITLKYAVCKKEKKHFSNSWHR